MEHADALTRARKFAADAVVLDQGCGHWALRVGGVTVAVKMLDEGLAQEQRLERLCRGMREGLVPMFLEAIEGES